MVITPSSLIPCIQVACRCPITVVDATEGDADHPCSCRSVAPMDLRARERFEWLRAKRSLTRDSQVKPNACEACPCPRSRPNDGAKARLNPER
jgi:hypothetical protein